MAIATMRPHCEYCYADCWRPLAFSSLPDTIRRIYLDVCAHYGQGVPDYIRTCEEGQAAEREVLGVSADDITDLFAILQDAEEFFAYSRG